MTDKNKIIKHNTTPSNKLSKKLLDNIVSHIESAKSHVASYTNSALVALYWNVGSLIGGLSVNLRFFRFYLHGYRFFNI